MTKEQDRPLVKLITEKDIMNILIEYTHDSPGARRAAKAIVKLYT